MADREERRFAEVSRESVKLIAESAGVELGDDVAALLAEDVCYRLREVTQVCMKYLRVTMCRSAVRGIDADKEYYVVLDPHRAAPSL